MIIVNADLSIIPGNARTSSIILPENVYMTVNTGFFLEPIMNQYWLPIERTVFIDFSNSGGTKYRNPFLKTQNQQTINLSGNNTLFHIIATRIFPRIWFIINNDPGIIG